MNLQKIGLVAALAGLMAFNPKSRLKVTSEFYGLTFS